MSEQPNLERDWRAEAEALVYGDESAWERTGYLKHGIGTAMGRVLVLPADEGETKTPPELEAQVTTLLHQCGMHIVDRCTSGSQVSVMVDALQFTQRLRPRILAYHNARDIAQKHATPGVERTNAEADILRAKVRGALFEGGYAAWKRQVFGTHTMAERQVTEAYFKINDRPAVDLWREIREAARSVMQEEAGIATVGVSFNGRGVVFALHDSDFNQLKKKLTEHGPGELAGNVRQIAWAQRAKAMSSDTAKER